jgi:hypothetical protein
MKRPEEKKASSSSFLKFKPRKAIANFVDLLSSKKQSPSPRSQSSSHHQRKHSAPAASTYSVKSATIARDFKRPPDTTSLHSNFEIGRDELPQTHSSSMIGKYYVVQSVASTQPKYHDYGASKITEFESQMSKIQRPTKDVSTSVQLRDSNLGKFASSDEKGNL